MTQNWTHYECEWCIINVKETVEHLVVECEGHKQEREELMDAVRELIGEAIGQ